MCLGNWLKSINGNYSIIFSLLKLVFYFFIYRKDLWVEAHDLYLTFLASAVEHGARLPLNPDEPEG